MPVYAPNGIEIVIRAIAGGTEAQANVLHAIAADLHPTNAEVIAATQAVHVWCDEQYKTIVGDNVLFTEVEGRDISQADGFSYTEPLDFQGTNIGTMLPYNAAMCVKISTTRGGRRGRGRVFLFTTVEGNTDAVGVRWINDFMTAANAVMEALDAALRTAATPWAVFSRADAHVYQETSWTVRPYVCSQRDRLPFHRRHRTAAP